jgi:hypothetical protein
MNVLTKVVKNNLNIKEVLTNIIEFILEKDHTTAYIQVVSNPSLRFLILKGIK